jgi:hypothetical protein
MELLPHCREALAILVEVPLDAVTIPMGHPAFPATAPGHKGSPRIAIPPADGKEKDRPLRVTRREEPSRRLGS